jgi:hypothetical protein
MVVALRLWTMMIVLAMALSAQASKKPDFSGTWELDLQRTRFGKVPQPKSLLIQIEHHEPEIRVVTVTTTDKAESSKTLDLTTDGKPHSRVVEGQLCAATAHWDQWTGTRLVAEEKCTGSSVSRHFTLGGKGKILTTVLTLSDGSGQRKAYEFFFRK